MKYEVLLNSVLRLPIHKGGKLLEEYLNSEDYKSFYEQQRVLDILTHKVNTKNQIKDEVFNEAFVSLCFMIRGRNEWSLAAFENIKSYPMIIWMETIGSMEPEHIMSLLKNFHKDLPSSLIETCIINLPEDLQVIAIDKYYKEIDKDSKFYPNFFYSISEKARLKLNSYYPDILDDDILLELEDLDESIVVERLSSDKERLMKLSSDELIEFILLKATKVETLNIFLGLYKDKVNECSIPKFELLFTRYRYIKSGRWIWTDEDESNLNLFSDTDLINMFKNKFHEIGIEETLSLFDHNWDSYSANEFVVDVVLEFIDIAHTDVKNSKYVNDVTITEIIKRFEERCKNKEYTLEEFEKLVKGIGKNGKTKLIYDDYIEAIIACGKLLKDKVINDKDPLFLELREKFTTDLIGRCKKDGTYMDNISLNGVFYRLAKGSIPFYKVYMTKTYRGLIYISKCGQLIDNADYITNFLTDEQLVKLNITPVIRWKSTINRTNTKADNLSFVERMGLQLLCYFGRDKGKYLLESDMQGNRMENLFDGLKYEDISIDEDGNPIANEELFNFLFGRGMMKETNSIINKMIRGEIPEFEKYFTEFCNSYENVKDKCNGILSVKRIIKHFVDVKLPIELKPNQVRFKPALKELNTVNPGILNEAVKLCEEASEREFSTIPKVKGNLGDFTYEVLDLDDPIAVAVGNLSHCCFVIRGISHSALEHSMKSKNGRTFVVYYKGQFFAQSWIWRNGDVICFDSVEAGSPIHGMYKDNIRLVDVYKCVAQEMLYISKEAEDELQRVKVVTVGKSDYIFTDLKKLKGDIPRPLENGIDVYDSNEQQILAGTMPTNPRYGVVGAQYRDPRKRAVIINDIGNTDIDTLDDIAININSLRYQINGDETPIDYSDYTKIISGNGWYILINNNGIVESGAIDRNKKIVEEYEDYLARYGGDSLDMSKRLIKRMTPLTGNNI